MEANKDLLEQANKVIDQLLRHLPDNKNSDLQCWNWAWDELDEEVQDQVQEVRKEGVGWLMKYAVSLET